jgi:hypothetical protein
MQEKNITNMKEILISKKEKNKKFKNSIKDLIVKIFNNNNN